jgi:hypothetical protein
MPSSPNFKGFLAALRIELADRLKTEWAAHRTALFQVGERFIERTREDLERWSGLLAVGALTRKDFDWLVQGRRDLAGMEALQNAGLSIAQADRFRSALVETIVGTAFRHFL